jgi:hypothetical protein
MRDDLFVVELVAPDIAVCSIKDACFQSLFVASEMAVFWIKSSGCIFLQ